MQQGWTVLGLLRWLTDYFSDKGISAARHDAECLLGAALAKDRVGLYLCYDQPLQADELDRIRPLVKRRAAREPLQYILGETEFWSLPLQVSPAVLIPRADTEVLVEEALARLREQSGSVLDVGTGSGAIAIAVAHDSGQKVEALDVSEAALELARANVARNHLTERVLLRRGDLYRLDGGPYRLLLANPPYIARAELDGLMPEVAAHEPRLALDGGPDGLDAYRALAAQAPQRLVAGGWLLLEVGDGQAEAVAALLAAAGLSRIYQRRDYGGLVRVVGGCRS